MNQIWNNSNLNLNNNMTQNVDKPQQNKKNLIEISNDENSNSCSFIKLSENGSDSTVESVS